MNTTHAYVSKAACNCTAAIAHQKAAAQEDEFSVLNGNQHIAVAVEQHPAVPIRTDEDMNMYRGAIDASRAPIFNSENQFFSLYARDFIGYLRDSLISVHVHLALSRFNC